MSPKKFGQKRRKGGKNHCLGWLEKFLLKMIHIELHQKLNQQLTSQFSLVEVIALYYSYFEFFQFVIGLNWYLMH